MEILLTGTSLRRIIAVSANVICWLYPTMNNGYLISTWYIFEIYLKLNFHENAFDYDLFPGPCKISSRFASLLHWVLWRNEISRRRFDVVMTLSLHRVSAGSWVSDEIPKLCCISPVWEWFISMPVEAPCWLKGSSGNVRAIWTRGMRKIIMTNEIVTIWWLFHATVIVFLIFLFWLIGCDEYMNTPPSYWCCNLSITYIILYFTLLAFYISSYYTESLFYLFSITMRSDMHESWNAAKNVKKFHLILFVLECCITLVPHAADAPFQNLNSRRSSGVLCMRESRISALIRVIWA